MPNTTPDTAAYLYLGLAAIVTIMGIFIASIVVRYSNYRAEIERVRHDEKSQN